MKKIYEITGVSGDGMFGHGFKHELKKRGLNAGILGDRILFSGTDANIAWVKAQFGSDLTIKEFHEQNADWKWATATGKREVDYLVTCDDETTKFAFYGFLQQKNIKSSCSGGEVTFTSRVSTARELLQEYRDIDVRVIG